MFKKIIPILCLFVFIINDGKSELKIGKIFLERKEVFTKDDPDWFFASPLLNALHSNTKKYIIADELMFEENSIVDYDAITESERNLRATGLFQDVKIKLDTLANDLVDVQISTKERWSLYTSILFGSGGGATNYGGRLEEFNLAGYGTYLSLEALHRGEHETGWQGFASLDQKRIFRSELNLKASLTSNKYKTEQGLSLEKTYRTLITNNAYGFFVQNQFGQDFLFNNTDSTQLMPVHEKSLTAWYSQAWWKKDRVFFTVLLDYNDVNRGKPEFERAFDNSGKLLFAFSSVAQEYIVVNKINSYSDEDMNVGGWGMACLGKIFPVGHKGEGFYYVAAQGEQSYYDGKNYLFGQISASSAFVGGESYFTYQEFLGKAFHRFNKHLLIAANVRQQTSWNWYKIRQLILDNDSGLRGYELNELVGDNRLVANFELRMFPELTIGVLDVSAAAFWDIGTAWRQTVQIKDTRWHNSAGLGARFHFTKSNNASHIFRIDLAYNFDKKNFGGIIFTSRQLFSAFQNHDFKLPKLFGLDFDKE